MLRCRVGLDGVKYRAQWSGLGRFPLQRGRELRLAARSLHVHHQRTGHRSGQIRAVVVFDQRQREVDSRGDAGRSVDSAVTDKNGVGLHLRRRVAQYQLLGMFPVRGGAAAVE